MAQISKRDQILETATKLFMENGFSGVSVDQIAAAVPVSKPTLYAHFQDKKDLFAAVIHLRCERAVAAVRAEILPTQSPQESLEAFATHFLTLLMTKQSLQFHRVMIGESEKFPDMARMFFESGPSKMHDLLEEYLSQMHKDGKLYIPNPSLSADIFLGMLKGRGHFKSLIGIATKEDTSEARKQEMVKTAVNIFIHGQMSKT